MPAGLTNSDDIDTGTPIVSSAETQGVQQEDLEHKIAQQLTRGEEVSVPGNGHDMIGLYATLLAYVRGEFLADVDANNGISYCLTGREGKGKPQEPGGGRGSREFDLMMKSGFLGMKKTNIMQIRYAYHLGSGATTNVTIEPSPHPYREALIEGMAEIIGRSS